MNAMEMKLCTQCNQFTKPFLFLFDGNVGFSFRKGTMGMNFTCELVAQFSMQNAQGSLFMQVLVGLFDPIMLVLAMLINQRGNGRAVSSL